MYQIIQKLSMKASFKNRITVDAELILKYIYYWKKKKLF